MNRFMQFSRNNSDALTQMGLGLLSGQTGPQQASMGLKGFTDARMSARQRNATLAMLQSEAPQLAAAIEQRLMSPKEAFSIHYQQKVQAEKPQKPTDDIREYEFARGQGFQGSLQDWITSGRKAGATNVTVGGGKYGTIPQGYELVETEQGARLQAIPGGPVEAETQKVQQAQQKAGEQTKQYADIVMEDIGRARELASGWTTGAGSILSGVPGTSANDLRTLTATIRANIGFDRLQAMRESSPTGGALGQVTERELSFLQATMGNLEQSQSTEQFIKNLNRLEDIYEGIMEKFSAYPGAGGSAPANVGVGNNDPLGIR
jgi:hypothetical protein